MNYNIQDLYNRSSEALINALRLNIKLIGINSSIRSLDIQFHYLESLTMDGMIAKYEVLDKQSKRQALIMEQKLVKQDIALQIQTSIMHALTLLDISIRMHSRLGIAMSKTLFQSNLKFIKESNSNILIPLVSMKSQIMNVYVKLIDSEYKNDIDLVNVLNQLMGL